MGTIQGASNSSADQVIEQYKSYYKSLNLAQYGTGVLLQTLGASDGTEDMFTSSAETNGLEDLFSSQSVNLSINKDNIKKKLWSDLEKEIQAFTNNHKELKGNFVIAINYNEENGLPQFRVAKSESVEFYLGDDNKSSAADAINNHPVQVFDRDKIAIEELNAFNSPELSAIVENFMQKNKGVFQYLANV